MSCYRVEAGATTDNNQGLLTIVEAGIEYESMKPLGGVLFRILAGALSARAVNPLVLSLAVSGTLYAAESTDWKIIGTVLGGDQITRIHVTNLLLSEGIESMIGGSRAHGISVRSAKVVQAKQLLRSDASKIGYYISFGTNDVPKPKPRLSRVAIPDALKNPDYSSESDLGRFLRSTNITQLAQKYPFLVSFAVYERQYLATTNTYRTGYDIEMELQKSLRKDESGYRGRFQVYDGGKEVNCLGSSEWKFDDMRGR